MCKEENTIIIDRKPFWSLRDGVLRFHSQALKRGISGYRSYPDGGKYVCGAIKSYLC